MKDQVRSYWNEHPLYSYEFEQLKSTPTVEMITRLDQLKFSEESFSYPFWEFDRHSGERVLEIGCGPGCFVRKYSRGKANIIGLDLTHQAARLTHLSLKQLGLKSSIVVGDAENLPFKKESFDLVASNGVLHHTPNTEKALHEALLVLKKNKQAIISLYYKNILLKKNVFPWVIRIMKLLRVSPKGRESISRQLNPDDFIRTYDGDKNPVGKGYTWKESQNLFHEYKILDQEIHYFPKRFLPFPIPHFIHRLLDRFCGTLIYSKLERKS